jgi:hypothetical protein
MTEIPLPAAPVAMIVPALDDGALRDAVGMLAQVRVAAAHVAGGVGSRRRDEGAALDGDAGGAVARAVATLAHAARDGGLPIADLLLALRATVRAAWGPTAIGPREAVVRDAGRRCVQAFYEARAEAAAAPAAAATRSLP